MWVARLACRLRWLNVSSGLLVLLLQRMPMLRAMVSAESEAIAPAASLLRSAIVSAVALSGVNALSGASTYLVTSTNLPAQTTVGDSFQMGIAIQGLGVSHAQSWDVTNTLPPGITPEGATLNGDLWEINQSDGNLVISGVATEGGTYTFTVTGYQDPKRSGNATSGSTSIIVAGGTTGGGGGGNTGGGTTGAAPTISVQPTDLSANAGALVILQVSAKGSPTPTYQWYKDNVAISGAISNTLKLSNVQPSDAGAYSVTVTNSSGSVTSRSAQLTIKSTQPAQTVPEIVAKPLNLSVDAGESAALDVVATGTPAPAYQWFKNDVALPGQTSAALMLEHVSASDAGNYTVEATNALGATTSQAGVLQVVSGQVHTLANLSVRANLASSQLLTVGFVANGSKNLLVRAAGPALGALGVASANPDPQIKLFDSTSTQIDANDNWEPSLAAAFGSLGAFPFAPGSLDAALLDTVSGANSAQISGSASGVVLVEVYDASSAGSSRLKNVSARNLVGTGDNVLIAGFVVGGTSAETVLVRGVGPKLADFGVNGVLADPILTIYDQTGTEIASNDNWDSGLSPVFAQVGAFDLATDSKDAALVISLPPGAYTANLSGVGVTSGDAIIEVYELP